MELALEDEIKSLIIVWNHVKENVQLHNIGVYSAGKKNQFDAILM